MLALRRTRPALRLELVPLLLALLGAGAATLLFTRFAPPDVPDAIAPWLRVGARSHPLVVHFPIALLVLALVYDLLFRRKKGECGDSAYWTLVLGTLGGVVSATSGWLHGALEPHSDAVADLVDSHRWFAIGATGAALVAAVAGYAFRTGGARWILPIWRVALVLAVLLSAVAGHLGGTLVYGEGFLFEPLDEARDARSKHESTVRDDTPTTGDASVVIGDAADLGPPVDYAKEVRPILDRHCIECHGATKKKGQLRLDRWTERIAGGKKAVIIPGRPGTSEMLRRVLLPKDDEDFMPPEKDPLPKAEIELLHRWIAQGASWPKDAAVDPNPGDGPVDDPDDEAGNGGG